MNHGYLVYSMYIQPENLGHQKFAAHIPLAKLPLALVLGGSRVVFTQNTPDNRGLYITYTL